MPNAFMLAALAYEAKGFSVIPLKPKDKIPLVPQWVQYQSERADREQIGKWWRQWPNANIGLITGAISGYVAVDIDSDAARAEFKSMCAEHDLDHVGVVSTGKGWHLYFARPPTKMSNKAGIRPGIDFRGDGGYVVAPPSVHPSGRIYEWKRPLNGDKAQLPEGFVQAMNAPTTAEGYRQRFDTAAALSGVPLGSRDEVIFKLASKLRGADVPYDIALELCEGASASCEPPFREAKRKVDQAYKYAPGHSSDETSKQASFWPAPLNAQELIDLPPDPTRWVWFECLPLRSTSALIAKAYIGKSTFAASLALAVARGIDFLGRPTQQGAVLYVYLDGPQDELKENLLNIGLCGSDPIFSYAGRKPDRVLDWCKEVCVNNSVKLLIIDTAQKFFGFKEDRYEEKINAMQPMLDLVNDQNLHAMFTYHAAKNSFNSISALGSVASEANARTSLYLRKKDDTEYRIFDTLQNTGKKFESIILSDPKDGFITKEGTLWEIEIRETQAMAINEIRDTPGITQDTIRARLMVKNIVLSKALANLRQANQIERTGRGMKGDPFKYFLAGDLVPKPPATVIDMFSRKLPDS